MDRGGISCRDQYAVPVQSGPRPHAPRRERPGLPQSHRHGRSCRGVVIYHTRRSDNRTASGARVAGRIVSTADYRIGSRKRREPRTIRCGALASRSACCSSDFQRGITLAGGSEPIPTFGPVSISFDALSVSSGRQPQVCDATYWRRCCQHAHRTAIPWGHELVGAAWGWSCYVERAQRARPVPLISDTRDTSPGFPPAPAPCPMSPDASRFAR